METLVNILTKETQSLKLQYLSKTREWANKYYSLCEKRKAWNDIDWCNFFGLIPEIKNKNTSSEFLGFPKGFYNSAKHREYSKYKNEIYKILKLGLENYILQQLEYAELHYENSITKLADRISKKELNIEKLKVKTSHIGVNINTTLTDGEKIVRAFTIIASGEVQRPHYRYLIK